MYNVYKTGTIFEKRVNSANISVCIINYISIYEQFQQKKQNLSQKFVTLSIVRTFLEKHCVKCIILYKKT